MGRAWEGEAVRIRTRTPYQTGGRSRWSQYVVLLDENRPIAFLRDEEVRGFRMTAHAEGPRRTL